MASLARSLSTRVARIEKPKPLKNIIPNRHSFSEKEFLQSNPETYVELKTPDTPTHSGAEDVFMMLEIVSSNIQNKDYSNIFPLTASLISRLRCYGSQLEESYEERLDKIFEVIRNGAHDMCIEKQSRLNLLQLVELRASQWQLSPGSASYYASKSGFHHEVGEMVGDIDGGSLQLLGPGDVLKSSGKYSSPTRVPGKNYCKDEVVIRNSDSGKVMGIKGRRVHMIEELSETVISFQRVNPGAKERLVQITGPTEDKIIYAKNLMEDTIKRNASPVRELVGLKEVAGSNSSINSSASDDSNRLNTSSENQSGLKENEDDGGAASARNLSRNGRLSLGNAAKDTSEFKYSVHVLNDVIHISSTNLNLLNEAFSLLDSSYTISEDPSIFSTQVNQGGLTPKAPEGTSLPVASEPAPTPTPGAGPLLAQYSREFLLQCSKSKAAQLPPADMASIAAAYPAILRQSPVAFDSASYQKRWLEMEGKIASLQATNEDYLDSD